MATQNRKYLHYTPRDKISKMHIVTTIENIEETTNIVYNYIILVHFPFCSVKQYKIHILIRFEDIKTKVNDYKHISSKIILKTLISTSFL